MFFKTSKDWLSWIDSYTPKTFDLAEDVIYDMEKEIQRLTQENEALRERVDGYESALINIAEYWNQSPNYDACFDAAERTHILALEALEQSNV